MKMLVVDDDEVTRKLLKEVLEKEGHEISLASSAEEALKIVRKKPFPVILSDIRMADMDGIEFLREIKKAGSQSQIILMTGFGSMDGAIEAIQEGAFDYVSKPFKIEDLRSVVSRATKEFESLTTHQDTQPTNKFDANSKAIIGKSPKIVEVYKRLARAAMSASTVLISGESGTGKELVAKAIHDNSSRKSKRFVAVNCGALAENLLESELFGHVRGAFTGAVGDKRGLFDEASGGTLFLDEIGDITPALQIKLLRVLQESEIKPVGSTESRKVEVRVIAATHRDLETLVRNGKFREDLYYRLKVILIELPPLRERMEDLPELVGHFLALYADKNKKPVSHVSEEAMAILRTHAWPGNIRELEHSIERAVAMSRSSVLFPDDFPLTAERQISSEDVTPIGGTSLENVEKAHIIRVLQEVGYNKSRASEVLGIDRATLYRKAQRYGIDLRSKG